MHFRDAGIIFLEGAVRIPYSKVELFSRGGEVLREGPGPGGLFLRRHRGMFDMRMERRRFKAELSVLYGEIEKFEIGPWESRGPLQGGPP